MLNSVTVATSLPWLGWGPTNYQDPSMCFAARIPHVPAPHRHHYAPSQCLAGQLLQCSQHLSCMSPLWNQQHSKARFASNINAVLSLPGTKNQIGLAKKMSFTITILIFFNFYEGYICAPGTIVPMACVCQPQLINGHVLYQLVMTFSFEVHQ